MNASRGAISGRMLVLLVMLALALFLLINRELLWFAAKGLTNGEEDVSGLFVSLGENVGEQAIVASTPALRFRCGAMPLANRALGDRYCWAYVRSYEGVRALGVAYFFRQGRLESAKVDIPWWLHGLMANRLRHQFGEPTMIQHLPVGNQRLEGWRVANGVILYNRDPDLNPLQTNTVFWMSRQHYGNVSRSASAGNQSTTAAQWLRWLLSKWVH